MYGHPWNQILIVQINQVDIANVLVDLGARINIITHTTMITLGQRNLKPTRVILELVDWFTITTIGELEDITISLDSWKFPVNVLLLHTQSLADGHPSIL